jgi:hypothetical protein
MLWGRSEKKSVSLDVSDDFDEILKEIESETGGNNNRPKAIESWCKRFGWSQEVVDLAKKLVDKMEQDLKLGQAITKPQILIALISAAAGYAVDQERKKHSPTPEPQSQRPSPKPQPQKWALILVINADKGSAVLDIMRQGQKWPNGDSLYQYTQFLWFGPESGIHPELNDWLDKSLDLSAGKHQESEYDVYLIRIDVDQDIRGFHQGINQIDRLDAFRQIVNIGKIVKVSLRLPSDAYKEDVWSR